MGDKEDYLTEYRVFFEKFAATVNPEDQLPVHIAGYSVSRDELPGEVLYWTMQYLSEKQCPLPLMTYLQRMILDEVQVAVQKHPTDFGYRTEESVYEALKLMQAVTARVNEVCLRYVDNSRLDTLPPPPTLKNLRTVSHAVKNARRVMEDRHVEIGNLEALFGIETSEPTSFYAVYDGHAGSAAATYCAAHLHQYLVESQYFRTDLCRALKESFIRTDDVFVRKCDQSGGGSTAVAVCIRGRTLYAAWAGDSQALLAKRLRFLQLVRPHKPSREDEKNRIESTGGTVVFWGTWRVNGQLAVSRAIGDAQYKPCVTACPDIITEELDGDEDFVVLACDGLWDFVSEDLVSLIVYRHIAHHPDDFKAVTHLLVAKAKEQGSGDNISVIVVFLKEPRDIAADNASLPMELGLDNGLANPPPFAVDGEACKRPLEATTDFDNGVDNSDSDSEDLGPETAVDVDDVDADQRQAEPTAPTPPADMAPSAEHVDNVAESGDDSEDEWNYFKGEGDGKPQEPRAHSPLQDNSVSDSSSVDMNSSPLNPDAPVFVPGGVAGADVILAESPRKPLPMDDIELPDVAQFRTEAVVRPADLLDLDNCDQLNGHHNVSLDEAKQGLENGNEKTLDSLGFGFGMDVDSEKTKEAHLIEDLQRIQKDTTDFCNIQVFQAHADANPLPTDIDEELFERLKNKERDPMSMSFYQEKDDDTCERVPTAESQVDLNAVQTLPDSDEEDTSNGNCENESFADKENVHPDIQVQLDIANHFDEPNNDIMRFDDIPEVANNVVNVDQEDNFIYHVTSSDVPTHSQIDFESSNGQQPVAPTDTPESHKLLFEQIPEIPDGKSSELGFVGDDIPEQDISEGDKDARPFTPQDESSQVVEMESKTEDIVSSEPDFDNDKKLSEPVILEKFEQVNESFNPFGDNLLDVHQQHDVDLLNGGSELNNFDFGFSQNTDTINKLDDQSQLFSNYDTQQTTNVGKASPFDFTENLVPAEPIIPSQSPLPANVALPRESPLPADVHELIDASSPVDFASAPVDFASAPSPLPEISHNDALLAASPVPNVAESLLPPGIEQLEPSHTPVPTEDRPVESPVPAQVSAPLSAFSELKDEALLDRLAPELTNETSHELNHDNVRHDDQPRVESPSGPAPDIVPEQQLSDFLKSEPVTDIDVGITESRAQEICVPITNEISSEDIGNVTPPPTPSVEATAPQLETLLDNTPRAPVLNETPIAADIEAPAVAPTEATIAAGAAAAAAASAVVAAAAAKVKATPAKKSPTTPKPSTTSAKPSPKPTAAALRTPASATKKPAPTAAPKTTPTAKPLTPKAPISKTTAAKPTTPKPLSIPKAAPAKPAPAKEAPAKLAGAKTTTTARPAPRPAPIKAPTAATKTVPATRAPLSAPKAPATAPKAPLAAKPAPRPARPAAAAPLSKPAPKPLEKKPLANGDVKPLLKKAPSTTLTARSAPPKPTLSARTAPKPTPRAVSATAPTAASQNKITAAPRPAPRATPRPPLDKQSKDLANKRLTAKAAPPRTATTKVSLTKNSVPKSVPKKPAVIKQQTPTVTNGAADDELIKPPPSPPLDNALLPDVIA